MQNSNEMNGASFFNNFFADRDATDTAWRSGVGFKTKAGPITADQTHPLLFWLSVCTCSLVVVRSGERQLLQFCLIFRTKRLSETDTMPEPKVSKTKVEKEHDASKKAEPPLADNDAQG